MNTQRSQKYFDNAHNPIILATLRILEFIALFGAINCALGLLMEGYIIPDASLVLYGAWFILCVEAIEAMIQGRRWGAGLLGGTTLFMTVAEIIRGEASIGGATMGIVIAVLIVAYLRDYPDSLENTNIS